MQATDTDIKPFLDDNFLLENRTAEMLYHDYAKEMPIIDYHNHLPPDAIAGDQQFPTITSVWLSGDHYKWRAMRALGIPEKFITGDASDLDKFRKWAETVPYTARNPLYHWTHLELRRYFDIHEILNGDSADEIFAECSRQLATPAFSTQGLLRKMRVEVVCSTDDPIDDLRYHDQAANLEMGFRLLPAFRPDKAILIEREGFADYIKALGQAAEIEIKTFDDLLGALHKRMEYFHSRGCRLSDHGLEQLYAENWKPGEIETLFAERLRGGTISSEGKRKYMSAILYHLGKMYAEIGWVQQFHLGALRNANTRMLRVLGPDTGFDSIGDYPQATAIASFFDKLDNEDKLAKTILYNLNPADNEIIATMIGNYNDGSVRGKMQFGSAWWFLDQKHGMEQQLNALSNMGLLSCFVGMLTDSRSFLSFPRHEYFRRLLCNLIGRDVHNGELPEDHAWLGGLVQDICYRNAKQYFGW